MEYMGNLCFIIYIHCSCYTYSTYGTVSTDLTTLTRRPHLNLWWSCRAIRRLGREMERQGDVTAQLYFLQPGPWPGTHSCFQDSSTQILSPRFRKPKIRLWDNEKRTRILIAPIFSSFVFPCHVGKPHKQLSFPTPKLLWFGPLKNGGAQNKQSLWISWPVSQ